MIQFKDLRFNYGKSTLYDNFQLQLMEPGIHGLFGTNGTGKSTLLKLINGLIFPISGTCEVYGEKSMYRHPDLLEKIFYLPEEIDSPSITALALGQLKGAFYPRFDLAKLTELLSIFGIPEDNRINQMSYGQKKKAYIAIALASGAPLLLMDEPTNGLDIPSKLHFRQAIEQFRMPDQIILISTHQVRDLDDILQYLLILQDGKILFQQSIQQIQHDFKFVTTLASETPNGSLFSTRNGDMRHHILRNNTGQSQTAHLETLITAFFEQPQFMQDHQ